MGCGIDDHVDATSEHRSDEKSIYILICSLATEANLTGIKTNRSCTKNCPHQVDGPLGCDVFEIARVEIVQDMEEFCVPVWSQFFFVVRNSKRCFVFSQ